MIQQFIRISSIATTDVWKLGIIVVFILQLVLRTLRKSFQATHFLKHYWIYKTTILSISISISTNLSLKKLFILALFNDYCPWLLCIFSFCIKVSAYRNWWLSNIISSVEKHVCIQIARPRLCGVIVIKCATDHIIRQETLN